MMAYRCQPAYHLDKKDDANRSENDRSDELKTVPCTGVDSSGDRAYVEKAADTREYPQSNLERFFNVVGALTNRDCWSQ